MQEILNNLLVKNQIKHFFKNKEIEIIERPASYIIKQTNEQENKVARLILLPSKGFTANKINETSSHPETRKAKITIKGAIRVNKKKF